MYSLKFYTLILCDEVVATYDVKIFSLYRDHSTLDRVKLDFRCRIVQSISL